MDSNLESSFAKSEDINPIVITGNLEEREEKKKRIMYESYESGTKCCRCGKLISKIKKHISGDTDFNLCHECEVDLKGESSEIQTSKILDKIRR